MRHRKANSAPDQVDHVARWRVEARHHATELHWDPERIDAVMQELDGVFGASWIRSEALQGSRYPLTGDPKFHPVARDVASPHRTSVAALIELAVYLRSCRHIPRFDEVASHLRAASQFTTGRMQLALAHRLRRAGAVDVEFEPRSDGGRKSDLFFRFGGRNHLVECYEPALARNSHFDDLLHYGLQERVLATAREARRRVIVRIDLHGPCGMVDAALRKRIEQEAKHLIRKLAPPLSSEKKKLEHFTIDVADTEGMEEAVAHDLARSYAKPGSWFLAPGTANLADVTKIARGARVPVTRVGWFVVNYEPDDDLSEMQRLAASIEEKIAQVRRASDGALGIMVPITRFARLAAKFRREAAPLVTSLRTKVLGNHDALAGALVVDRVDDNERGPYMSGLFIEGREGRHLEELLARVEASERERRVLDDW